ncbi:uncharacterized protein LOC127532966 [Acanthochromis polyacanthus]|uniref:uncharacterized protein LOC127532966 n=1 Tax=Acanthochromis polyacanthus TaxID=80966 RepID=UPI002233EBE4|nr:uncharacterized protein LOC127532966 [Acanthochromis polyacanthus]
MNIQSSSTSSSSEGSTTRQRFRDPTDYTLVKELSTACPGVNSQSRIVDLDEAKKEAFLLQTQRLRAAELARTNSVLRRLGLCSQQDPLPSPPPPDALRCRPASPLQRRRMRPASSVSLPNLMKEDTEEMKRCQRSPDTLYGEGYQLNPGRDHISSPSASVSSEDSLSMVDAHTPRELKNIPLIYTPSPPPPPSAPLPKTRANRLSVMTTKLRGPGQFIIRQTESHNDTAEDI